MVPSLCRGNSTHIFSSLCFLFFLHPLSCSTQIFPYFSHSTPSFLLSLSLTFKPSFYEILDRAQNCCPILQAVVVYPSFLHPSDLTFYLHSFFSSLFLCDPYTAGLVGRREREVAVMSTHSVADLELGNSKMCSHLEYPSSPRGC